MAGRKDADIIVDIEKEESIKAFYENPLTQGVNHIVCAAAGKVYFGPVESMTSQNVSSTFNAKALSQVCLMMMMMMMMMVCLNLFVANL